LACVVDHPALVVLSTGPEAVRTALAGAARAYRYRSAIGGTLRRRQDGLAPETLARSLEGAAAAARHLPHAQLTARGKPAGVAVAAVARELAGFASAEMTS